jgi:hypothetical protein
VPLIVTDIDGTLCTRDGTARPLVKLLRLAQSYDLVVVTHRPEERRAETMAWLRQQGLDTLSLIMRPEGVNAPNVARKAQLKQAMALGEVVLYIDDQYTLRAMGKALGLDATFL